ncbi:aminodeoxychorismate lyase [Methylophaga sp. 42_8_T64]|nr:aminodeoxychorismate lyase [Methylophaga sp. 42_8_T64]
MKLSLSFKILLPLLIVLSVSIFSWLEYQRFIITPLAIDEEGYNYQVKAGTNLSKVSKELSSLKLTNLPPIYLDIFGRLEGRSHLIKTGEFHIKSGTTLPELLDQLIAGKVVQHAITLIEGMTIQQVMNIIAVHPHITQTLANSDMATVMASLGKPESHAEGWFYPETYHFPTGTTDIEFLKRAHQQMVTALDRAWQNKAEKLPYKTPYEALIMASIIEKETGIAEERAQIAGVFVRRLQKGMRLQTDPTVIYGLGDSFDGNLRRKDLKTDTAYNTYTRFGLPPTPIALASIESLEAALHPADGKSLYFVATGQEGRHVFSSNLRDHNNAVRRYQLKK